MNKKGFTLIELMSVITLILIIMTSLVLIVSRMANDNKNDLYESKITLIELAAKEYGEDHINELSDDCTYVSVEELLDLNYIKSDDRNSKIINDPRTNESMNDITICVRYDETVNVSLDDSSNGNIQGVNLYNLIKNNALTDIIDFGINSGTSGTNGIYTTTETDNGNPVYYYRGSYNSINNNLIFNNFCWKIIRTTETSGIKIIYNGVPGNGQCTTQTGYGTHIGNHIFSEGNSDNADVGYMYGTTNSNSYEATHANTNDSAIKQKVDTWYANNMTNVTNKLEDTIFCNDRSMKVHDSNTIGDISFVDAGLLGYKKNTTLYSGAHRVSYYSKISTPSLKCTQVNDKFTVNASNGNGVLTYPVGLITLDEVVFAGFNTYHSNKNNYQDTTNYLYTNHHYWTMTPVVVSDDSFSWVGYVQENGYISNGNTLNGFGVRPVVSLKFGTLVTGSGSTTNPYVVQ